LSIVTGLGWALIVLILASWVMATRLHWLEFGYVTVTLAVLVVVGALLSLGRVNLKVELNLDPQRLTVGDTSIARLGVTNQGKSRLLALAMAMPVGQAVARYTLSALAPGHGEEQMTLIPASQRGVITVGPVTSLRGDPFSIFQRRVAWTDPVDMFIHPRTVPLDSLGSGLLRDLEGQATNDVSASDLAFHALRPYAPGDDLRHIHWRSSAKHTAASGMDSFLVRQFLDTRRSHIAVLVDVNSDDYATPGEFELAISMGASVAVRALMDELDVTIVCGLHAAVRPPRQIALDTFSRAEMADYRLDEAAGQLMHVAADVSTVVICSGCLTEIQTFLHTAAILPPEVATYVLRVEPGAPMDLHEAGGVDIITVGALDDLPQILAAGVTS